MQKKQKPTKVTIDDLAAITAKGFVDVTGRLNRVENEISSMKVDISDIKTELKEFRAEFNDRTGHLEATVYIEHRKRLEKLEAAR